MWRFGYRPSSGEKKILLHLKKTYSQNIVQFHWKNYKVLKSTATHSFHNVNKYSALTVSYIRRIPSKIRAAHPRSITWNTDAIFKLCCSVYLYICVCNLSYRQSLLRMIQWQSFQQVCRATEYSKLHLHLQGNLKEHIGYITQYSCIQKSGSKLNTHT